MKIKWIIPTAVLLLVGSFLFYWFRVLPDRVFTTPAIPPKTVQGTPAKQTEIPDSVSTSGNLLAEQSIIISPKISGYIKEIFFHAGDQVRAGAPLIQLDDKEDKAALAQAQLIEKLNANQLERYKFFLSKGFITQDMFNNAKINFEQNRANVLTLESKLANKSIRAPFNGTVGPKTFNVGEFVNVGAQLTTLIDTVHLKIHYRVPSRLQNKIALGQTVNIAPENNLSRVFTGKVSYIDASVDPATQTINIHADITNSHNQLKPGQLVQISQQLGANKKKLVNHVSKASFD